MLPKVNLFLFSQNTPESVQSKVFKKIRFFSFYEFINQEEKEFYKYEVY